MAKAKEPGKDVEVVRRPSRKRGLGPVRSADELRGVLDAAAVGLPSLSASDETDAQQPARDISQMLPAFARDRRSVPAAASGAATSEAILPTEAQDVAPTTEDEFVDRILTHWRRAENEFVEVGRLLIQYSEAHNRTWVQTAKERLPFSVSTAQRLMRVAAAIDAGEIPQEVVEQLPPSYAITYEYLTLSEDERQRALAEGVVSPVAKKDDLVKWKKQTRAAVFTAPASAGTLDRTADLVAAARRGVVASLHQQADQAIRARMAEIPVALHRLLGMIADGMAGEMVGRPHGLTNALRDRIWKYSFAIADEMKALGMPAQQFLVLHHDKAEESSEKNARPKFEGDLALVDSVLMKLANTGLTPSNEKIISGARDLWTIMYPDGARPELDAATSLVDEITTWMPGMAVSKSQAKVWGGAAEDALARNPFGAAVEPLAELARQCRAAQGTGAALDVEAARRLCGDIAAALGLDKNTST